jgi:hypothetical protein
MRIDPRKCVACSCGVFNLARAERLLEAARAGR